MFIKGMRKPENSGRKKGSKNKKRVLKVEEVLLARGVNPVEQMLELIPQLSPENALRAWMELQKFVQAPIKSKENIEEPAEPIEDQPNTESPDELLALVNGSSAE